jgi:F-type H+-transporting ATPase subunit delta
MDNGLIPRRYAKALYKVAVERGEAERLYDLMNALDAAFTNESQLRKMVANPFISQKDKDALITAASGAKQSDATFNDFLKLLAQNSRTDIVRAIADAYLYIFRQERHIYRVSVTSAAPLSKDVEDRLRRLITARLNGGTMEFDKTVDPELIGGFTITIDNERLDASVKNELKQLQLSLIN